MSVIDYTPSEFIPVHNCINYGLLAQDGINLIAGTQATYSIIFDSGGTATNGTIIYIQGQKFIIDNTASVADGYKIKFNGLTDLQRATWLYQTLRYNLFFNPSVLSVVQFGNTVTVTYSQVGQQSNWQFDNGGITEISFYLANGTDRIDLSGAAYVWGVYEDRAASSLTPVELVANKILPVLLSYDYSTVPATISMQPQTVNISDEVKSLVSTTLPGVYDPIFTPVFDVFFRRLVFMRAGLRYLDNCEVRNVQFTESATSWIYNCLFQSSKISDLAGILDPYISGYKPLLIKNTYSICRTTSFFIWHLCNENPLDVVYFDASGNALETSSFTYGDADNELKPTFMNVGGFGQTIPANCAYYILNYMNADSSEILHAVRFNVTDCNCVVGEFIFCTDLGDYETITFSKLEKHDITVSSDTIKGKDGCTLTSLIKGNRSITNTDSEVIYTMSSKFVANPDEIEFVEQFKRSQSFYMKYFFEAADSYGYIKVIPESINFAPIELGKANELQITFRLNKSYKSHPQNEAVYI